LNFFTNVVFLDTLYVKVENLKVNDLILMRGDIHGNSQVNCVTKYRPVNGLVILLSNILKKMLCQYVSKDAFDVNVPSDNLYISHDHNLIVHGKLVPARSLVDNKNIYRVDNHHKLDYYHMELENIVSLLQKVSYRNHN